MPLDDAPPSDAVRTAARGLEIRLKRQEGGTAASVACALRLVLRQPLDPADLATMAAGASHPITAALCGGPSGQRWAATILARANTTPPPAQTAASRLAAGERLRRLSKLLAGIDRDLRRDLTAATAQALADALRRAGVKVEVRARNKRAAMVALRDHQGEGFPPDLLAAIGVTDHELLDRAFASYSGVVTGFLAHAQARRRRAVVRTLGVPPDDLEGWQAREDDQRSTAAGLLVTGLTTLAYARLADPTIVFPDVGEIPAVPSVPPGLISDAVRVSNGAPVVPDPASGRDIAGGSPLTDGPNPLVAEVVGEVEPVTTIRQVWIYGDSARPFEPHQELDGWLSEDSMTWFPPDGTPADAVGKPEGEWPYELDHWEPLDHPGCGCDLSNGWDVFDQ